MAHNEHPAYREQIYQNRPVQLPPAPQYNQPQSQYFPVQQREYSSQNGSHTSSRNGPYYGERQHVSYQERARQPATGRPYTSNAQIHETRGGSRAQQQHQDSRTYHYDESFQTHSNSTRPGASNGYSAREARDSPIQTRPGTSSSNRHPKRERILNDTPSSPKAAAWDNPFGVFPGTKKDLQNKAREDEERNRARTPSSRPDSSSSRPRTRDSRERATTPSSTRRPQNQSASSLSPPHDAESRPAIIQTTSQPEMPLQKRLADPTDTAGHNYGRVSLDGAWGDPTQRYKQQARPAPQRTLTGPRPSDATVPSSSQLMPQILDPSQPFQESRQPQLLQKSSRKRISEDVPRSIGVSESQFVPLDGSHNSHTLQEPLVLTRSNQTTNSFGAHDASAYRGVPVTNRRPSGTSDNPMPNFAAMSLNADKIEREVTMTAPTVYKKPVYGQSTPCLASTDASAPHSAVSANGQTRPSLDEFSFGLPRMDVSAQRVDVHGQIGSIVNPNHGTRGDHQQIFYDHNTYHEVDRNFRPTLKPSQFPTRLDSQMHSQLEMRGSPDHYDQQYRDTYRLPMENPQPLPQQTQYGQPEGYRRYDQNRKGHQDIYDHHQQHMENASYGLPHPRTQQTANGHNYYDERPYQDESYNQQHEQRGGYGTHISVPAPTRPLGYDDLYRKPAPPSGMPIRPRTANSIRPLPRNHPDMLPQHPLPSSTVPLTDRGHPPPIRPGLDAPAPRKLIRKADPGDRSVTHPPPRIEESSQPSASLSTSPVTKTELNHLQDQFRNNPNDFQLGLHFTKRLVEAAKTLAVQGTTDPKIIAKNRERYMNDAYRTVKRLVTAGSADAMFYLADSYGTGQLGLGADASEAFKLYNSAAKLGHAQATYRVAVCCELGQDGGGGTRRDHARAVQFYKRAATMGDGPAMYKMGMISLKGLLGVPVNAREGITWLKRAAERADKDNPHALHELGMLYESAKSTDVVLRDESYALSLYRQAADLGYKHSQWRLGSAYEYGTLTCPIDPHQSITWYSRAAKQNEHQSEFALSGWYLTGSPPLLEQSDQEAYLWARKAASSGLVKAEYAMGYYTETGIGVQSDLEEAKKWYFRAAAQGDMRARTRLEEIKKGGKKKERTKVNRKDVGRQNEGECSVM